jgi:hypothetical protein
MQARAIDPLLPTTARGIALWTGVGTLAFLAVASVPVATFLVLIVLFGLAHVLTELRYVDARFSTRIDRQWLLAMVALVGAIAMVRALLLGHLIPYDVGIALEVLLGIVMAMVGGFLAKRAQIVIGLGVLGFAAIAIVSPLHALMTIAILHNLTPLGFIADATQGRERRILLGALCVPFLAIPLFIATGAPLAVFQTIFDMRPDWTPFAAGPVERHFAAFLPPEVIAGPYAMSAFAGAVFAQSMHYLATIVVLPRLQASQPRAGTLAPWPLGIGFWIFCSIVCTALLAYYMADYSNARGLYGLFAAIHSWLEVPILIVALSGSALPVK